MIALLLLTHLATTLAAPPASVVVGTPHRLASQNDDIEFERRRREAGEDPAKLWTLYEWCVQAKRDKDAKATLLKIVKVDPLHKQANIALGNKFYDDKWFPDAKAIEDYKQQKDAEEKKARGLVEWKGQWVRAQDVPYLEKGLVDDGSGNWVTPETAQRIAEGWVLQDLEWISPAEKPNVEQGLWKCGDQWLSVADADKYHASITTMWKIPFEHFQIHTTCPRELVTERVAVELAAAYKELVKLYTLAPTTPPVVVVLRDREQYEQFASGSEKQGIPNTDSHELAEGHPAYYADFEGATSRFVNAGVSFWDGSSDEGHRWGTLGVRRALGHAYGHNVDTAPKTLAANVKQRKRNRQLLETFYAEKKLPRWFIAGAASYVERYYVDPHPKPGLTSDWPMQWSVKNLKAQGGMRPLPKVFAFAFETSSPLDGEKLTSEAGLLVAFARDGQCAPVSEKLVLLQTALKSGKDQKAVAAAATALAEAIVQNEDALKQFARL